MVKFLIIRFSSIGDIVLTTPVIRSLKEQIGDSEIHFLTKRSYEAVLKYNPYIDHLHLLDDSLKDTLSRLKDLDFDYIIDLHHNLRSSLVKSKVKAISFSFYKVNFEKWLMVQFKVNRLPDLHIVDRYMDTVSLFDLKNDGKGLDFFIGKEDEIDLSTLPSFLAGGYIGFVIGARHQTKKLPRERIAALIEKAGLPVVLLGGKEDWEDAEFIHQRTGNLSYNACGIYSLGQSASLVRQAKVIITHDTGLMHIAAAFHKKIISVWGNTIPEFGMSPYIPHPDSAILEIKDLRCRPCSKLGYPNCPRGHFKCMNELNIEEIAQKANALFN